jgi:hypothetical protein
MGLPIGPTIVDRGVGTPRTPFASDLCYDFIPRALLLTQVAKRYLQSKCRYRLSIIVRRIVYSQGQEQLRNQVLFHRPGVNDPAFQYCFRPGKK